MCCLLYVPQQMQIVLNKRGQMALTPSWTAAAAAHLSTVGNWSSALLVLSQQACAVDFHKSGACSVHKPYILKA